MNDDGLTQAPPGADGRLWFTVVRADEHAAPGQTTAIRLIGLLPPAWQCVSHVDHDRIALGIPRAVVPGTDEEVRAQLVGVVADSALSGWRVAP